MRVKASAISLRIGGWLFALLFVWHFALLLLLGATAPDPTRGLVYEIGSVYVTAFAYHLRDALFFGSVVFALVGMVLLPRDLAHKSEFKFSNHPLLATTAVISLASVLISLLVQFVLESTGRDWPHSQQMHSAVGVITYLGVGGWFLSILAIILRWSRDSAETGKDEPPSA